MTSLFDVGLDPDSKLPLFLTKSSRAAPPVVQAPSAADELKFDFGKYAGKSAYEIAEIDPQYLVWLTTNVPSRKDYVPAALLDSILGRA